MERLIIIIFFIVSITSSFAASEKRGIFLGHSESADYFEIMENLIMDNGEVSDAYKNSLGDKFFTNPEDTHWAKWYKEFRKKTSKIVYEKKEEKNLFSSVDLYLDFINGTFLESDRPLEALKKLQKRLKKEDLQALGKFYEHFNSKIAEVVRLSVARKAELNAVFKELKKNRFKNTIRKAATFLAVPKHYSKKIIMNFVWYPKDKEMKISYGKNFITVRIHPEKSAELTKNQIMKIFINYLMRVQPVGQKKLMTSRVIGECDPTKYFPIKDILEKSLSVVWGDIYFSSKIDRKEFKLYKTWSQNPWVNTYSKLLFPLAEKISKEKNTIMSKEFIDGAITTCDDLLTLGKFI